MDELTHLRAQRAHDRLATSIRHAALHATASELVDLDKLVILVRNGHLTPDDALDRVATLRRSHDTRRAA